MEDEYEKLYGPFVSGLTKEREVVVDCSTPTGIASLDLTLGGYLPAGAIEIYGVESSGKTTLLYEIMSTAQKNGMVVALCSSEYLDIPYMKKFGMDLDSLILITGNTGESVISAACDMIYKWPDGRLLLAIDSATSLRPKIDEYANWAVMIEMFLRVALPALGPQSSIVMTNQVRARRSIGADKFFAGGTTSTARNIAGMFSTRLELSRLDVTEESYTMIVDIVANQDTPPSGIIHLPVIKGHGVDTMLDLVRVAAELGVVTKAGSWYELRDHNYHLGQGEKTAALALSKRPEIASWVLERVQRA